MLAHSGALGNEDEYPKGRHDNIRAGPLAGEDGECAMIWTLIRHGAAASWRQLLVVPGLAVLLTALAVAVRATTFMGAALLRQRFCS